MLLRFFFAIFFISGISLKLSGQWSLIYEFNEGDCVKDIEFTSPIHGIFVTQNIIGVTDNKGDTWNLDTLAGITDLRIIDFIDSDTGILCCAPGDTEDLLLTYNGGIDWSYPLMNQGLSISNIDLVKGGNIIFSQCLGFTTSINITENFYSNNVELTSIPGASNCFELEFVTNEVGFATGDFISGDPFISTIYKTIDGGFNWYSNENMNGPLFYLDFVTEEIGYGVGYESRVWKTIDGGESWFMIPFDFGGYEVFDSDLSLGKIYFYSDSIGLLQLSKKIDGNIFPGIYRSNNGGESWFKTDININENQVNDFFCLSADTCFAATCGAIFRTTNGGGVDTNNVQINTHYQSSLLIYPNPASNYVIFKLNNDKIFDLKIINSLGLEILHIDNFIENELQISIDNFPSGIYYVLLSEENGNAIMPFTKIE